MEKIYLFLLILIFVLAVSDLVVNFSAEGLKSLNSVFTSRLFPVWLIFGIAGAGIILGALLSDGMLEIARGGIFNTGQFFFSEIITIFLAVILTEVLLINIFRTFGLPSSSTISVIFALLGGAVMASLTKTSNNGVVSAEFFQYLHNDKILAILSGFLLSLGFAFIIGFFIQWLTRVIFTFRYREKMRYFGGFYVALICTLLLVIVLSAVKKSYSLPAGWSEQIVRDKNLVLLTSFLIVFIISQLLLLVRKFNILNFTLLIGTFAVAFSFSGNDLANFTGVPLAALDSFNEWVRLGKPDPYSLNEGILTQPANANVPVLFLFGSAIFLGMLHFRKSQTYRFIKEESPRQGETGDKLNSYPVSRSIVRGSIITATRVGRYINPRIRKWFNSRFVPDPGEGNSHEKFDKLRGTNVLIISAMLVSFGTSYKIPLSTAYIIFMVTMGSSLGDKVWDRETAVHSISGIFSMMGSWFFNSFLAFVFAALITLLILTSGNIVGIALCILAIIPLIKILIKYQKREVIIQEVEEFPESTVRAESVLIKTNQDTSNAIIMISKAYFLGLNGFHLEDRQQLEEIDAEIEEFNQRMRKLKANIFKIIQKLQQDSVETGHYYVQIIDYLREMAHSIKFVVRPLYEHLGNGHKPFNEEQNEELMQFSSLINDFLNYSLYIIKESRFDQIEELIGKRQDINELMRDLERKQIRRIKRKETNSRNSVLFFTVMSESKNLLLQTVNLLKATRDFVSYTKS